MQPGMSNAEKRSVSPPFNWPGEPFHVALVEPDIPANAGNIMRLCAATGSVLHLVEPLGFRLTEKHLKRAAVDGWERVRLQRHRSIAEFLAASATRRKFLFTRRGVHRHHDVRYQVGDMLVFGSETRGLPSDLLQEMSEMTVAIPIMEGTVRCLNLSSAVAVALYEALRQVAGRTQNAV